MKKYSDETKRKALVLLKSYKSKKVAEALKIPIGTLYRWLSEERKREEEEGGALVQGQPSEIAQELQAQIAEVLEEIKLGIAKISVKSTADLKNLGSLLSQLCKASERLDVPIADEQGRGRMKNSKRDLYEDLNIRQLKIVLAILGDEKVAEEIEEDFHMEELDEVIVLLSTSDHPKAAEMVGILRKVRPQLEARLAAKEVEEEEKSESESQEDLPSEE